MTGVFIGRERRGQKFKWGGGLDLVLSVWLEEACRCCNGGGSGGGGGGEAWVPSYM